MMSVGWVAYIIVRTSTWLPGSDLAQHKRPSASAVPSHAKNVTVTSTVIGITISAIGLVNMANQCIVLIIANANDSVIQFFMKRWVKAEVRYKISVIGSKKVCSRYSFVRCLLVVWSF